MGKNIMSSDKTLDYFLNKLENSIDKNELFLVQGISTLILFKSVGNIIGIFKDLNNYSYNEVHIFFKDNNNWICRYVNSDNIIEINDECVVELDYYAKGFWEEKE